MAPLMRPIAEASLHPELKQETAMEQQILLLVQGLKSELSEFRGQMRDLRVVLMGTGEDGETAFGRLPMVEKKQSEHEGRIATLESEIRPLKTSRENALGAGRWSSHLVGMIIGGLAVGLITMIISHLMYGK